MYALVLLAIVLIVLLVLNNTNYSETFTDFNRTTKYKLQKIRALMKRYITEKLEKNKFVSWQEKQKAIENGLKKLDYLYMDVNFIHFLDNISYFYDQNKDDYISLVKCIGNILKLRWDTEQLEPISQHQIRTMYSNFEETVRLKELALNHFQTLILTIPKSNSSYKHHQALSEQLHKLLLRAIDIQRNYYTSSSNKFGLTTATQFLPNKNVYTQPSKSNYSNFDYY